MYYDDQARRFNLLSGLVFGAVLGAGIALLLPEGSGSRTRTRLRRTARSWRRTATHRLADLGEEVRDTVEGSLAGGRRRIGL